MYKKITHNIVEEHYSHPMAGEIKNMVEGAQVAPGIDTEPAFKIRMEAKQYLSDFAWRLRSYIINALDGGAELTVIEEYLNKTLAEIGKIISVFYGAEASAKAAQHLTGIMTGVFEAAKAAKANQPLVISKAKVTTHIAELAKLLGSANPMAWPETAVAELLTRAANAIVAQIEARQKRDWAADQAAADLANEILVTGRVGSPSFADVFARGLTRKMTQKFS